MDESFGLSAEEYAKLSSGEKAKLHSEHTGRILALWIHQNSIVWGRLQTISVTQGVVIAGWYGLFPKHMWPAILLAGLGVLLSYAVERLIDCDLEWRRKLGDLLRKEKPEILPDAKGATPGWMIISGISRGFFTLDVVLFVLSAYTLVQQY